MFNLVYIDNLEMVQKRGARFVTNNYRMETENSEFNLNELEWSKLEERKLEYRLNLLQKARLKLVDILTDHLHLRQTWQGGPVYDIEFTFVPQSTAVEQPSTRRQNL